MITSTSASIRLCGYCECHLVLRRFESLDRFARRRFCSRQCGQLSRFDAPPPNLAGVPDTTGPSEPPLPQRPATCGHCGASPSMLYFERNLRTTGTYLQPAHKGGAMAYLAAVGAGRCSYCRHLDSRHVAGIKRDGAIEVWCRDCHSTRPSMCLFLPKSIHKRHGRDLA